MDVKSQQRLASQPKWDGDRPIKVTSPRLVSTPRDASIDCRSFKPTEI
jgi:hypothetical protein